jgi:16S rRNA (guanine966-N2)-methyltransferase
MMRIIAGRLGGRTFESPGTHRTHPMSDKARGALFNTLGELRGLTVLDAFAGSGGLAYEAVSRGAREVLAIDIDVESVKTIAENVRRLGLEEQITVRRKNISGWSRNNRDKKFDLVFVDPPYDDIRPDVIERLAVHVKPGGLFILSWPGKEKLRDYQGFQLAQQKAYGDIQLAFYRPLP